MEQLLIGLVGASPAAGAAIFTCILFLKYLREERISMRDERKDWREALAVVLDKNSDATMAQTETMKALVMSIDRHDRMAREAIARLEAK